jgi:hypothetical protein
MFSTSITLSVVVAVISPTTRFNATGVASAIMLWSSARAQ